MAPDKNRRLTFRLPRYWSHFGDTFVAVSVIAFTLASLLIVGLDLNWRELTTRRD